MKISVVYREKIYRMCSYMGIPFVGRQNVETGANNLNLSNKRFISWSIYVKAIFENFLNLCPQDFAKVKVAFSQPKVILLSKRLTA